MEDQKKFKRYFKGLDYGNQYRIRRQIEKECYVSTGTISHWLSGRVNIPPLAKKEIERIANQKIF